MAFAELKLEGHRDPALNVQTSRRSNAITLDSLDSSNHCSAMWLLAAGLQLCQPGRSYTSTAQAKQSLKLDINKICI